MGDSAKIETELTKHGCTDGRLEIVHASQVVAMSDGAVEAVRRKKDSSVSRAVDLVKHGFYNGQRVHRVLPGFLVQWGDRTSTRLRLGRHRSFHAYRRPGRYRVTVTVTDKAGNVKRVVSVIKVTKPKSTGK